MNARTRGNWLSVLWVSATLGLLISSCSSVAALDSGLRKMLTDLPVMPESELLSEAWNTTGGSDSRCDGRLVGRLYGTQQPIEDVVAFFEQEMLGREGWSDDRPLKPLRDVLYVNVVNEDGYRLGVERVENMETAQRDPLFLHRDVIMDRPYATLYEVSIVHINARYVDHCWGHW